MDKDKPKDKHKKGIVIGVLLVAAVGGYMLLKRKSSTSSTGPTTLASSNNQQVALQTAQPGLIVINPSSGNNSQGNYGMSSNSSYAQALAQEAALSQQINTLTTNSNGQVMLSPSGPATANVQAG